MRSSRSAFQVAGVAAIQTAAAARAADPDHLNRAEARELLGISFDALDARLGDGTIEAHCEGRYWRISLASVGRYKEQLQPVKPRPKPMSRRQLDQIVARLDAEGLSPTQIAEAAKCHRRQVYASLDRQEIPRRRMPTQSADPALVQRLYEAGRSQLQIADECGISQSRVSQILTSRQVPTRSPRKHPPAEPRPCKACGRAFTPTYGSQNAKKFCPDCGPLASEFQTQTLRTVGLDDGLLTAEDVSRRLGRSAATVNNYFRRWERYVSLAGSSLKFQSITLEAAAVALLAAAAADPLSLRGFELAIPGAMWRVIRFAESDVESLESRQHLRRGRALAAVNPEVMIAKARGRAGGQITEAHEAEIRQAAQPAWAKIRGRRGGAPELVERKARWLSRVQHWLPRSANLAQACRAAALEDWAAHPEDWPRGGPSGWPSVDGQLDVNHARRAQKRLYLACNQNRESLQIVG